MASDLGEEKDTETEISGDIRNLLPREGSVYGAPSVAKLLFDILRHITTHAYVEKT